jgi:hypothetical protein
MANHALDTLAAKHLTEFEASLQKSIGDACVKYAADAIVRFKQEVVGLSTPIGDDKVVGLNEGVWGDISGNDDERKPRRFNYKDLTFDRPDEEVWIIHNPEEHPQKKGSSYEWIAMSLVISTRGNLYVSRAVVVEECATSYISGSNLDYIATYEYSKHVTDTPIAPMFKSVLVNALSMITCAVNAYGDEIGGNFRGITNLLDMNRKYFYALAANPNLEWVRREAELILAAEAAAARVKELEREVEDSKRSHENTSRKLRKIISLCTDAIDGTTSE